MEVSLKYLSSLKGYIFVPKDKIPCYVNIKRDVINETRCFSCERPSSYYFYEEDYNKEESHQQYYCGYCASGIAKMVSSCTFDDIADNIDKLYI